MLRRILPFASTVVTILLFSSIWAVSAYAASPCKGLSKTRCGTQSGCSWVDSYKTKSGTRVKGYCRAKPGKGENRLEDHKSVKSFSKGTHAGKKKGHSNGNKTKEKLSK